MKIAPYKRTEPLWQRGDTVFDFICSRLRFTAHNVIGNQIRNNRMQPWFAEIDDDAHWRQEQEAIDGGQRLISWGEVASSWRRDLFSFWKIIGPVGFVILFVAKQKGIDVPGMMGATPGVWSSGATLYCLICLLILASCFTNIICFWRK